MTVYSSMLLERLWKVLCRTPAVLHPEQGRLRCDTEEMSNNNVSCHIQLAADDDLALQTLSTLHD
jgi:hypothetical protein